MPDPAPRFPGTPSDELPGVLPAVEGDFYLVKGKRAAPRAAAGADVLPWRPARGVYLLLELGAAAPDHLVEIDGVAGVWWAAADSEEIESRTWFGSLTSSDEGVKQVSLSFTDGNPIDVAQRIQPVLEERWVDGSAKPLLAAPFHTVVPYDWDRHLP